MDRITGNLGFGIDLTIALEALFNIPSDLVTPYSDKGNIKANHYDLIGISLHSVVTSTISSIEGITSKDMKKANFIPDMVDLVSRDLYNIRELFIDNNIKLRFYKLNYSTVVKNVRIKDGVVGDKLVLVEKIASKVMEKYGNEYGVYSNLTLSSMIRNKRVLIITSYAVDLLNHKYSKSLDLLEPHTGRLVHKLDFSKKLIGSKTIDTAILPLTETTLYIFGDKHMIKGMGISDKRLVYKTLLKNKIRKDTNNYQVNKMLKDLPNVTEYLKNVRFIY